MYMGSKKYGNKFVRKTIYLIIGSTILVGAIADIQNISDVKFFIITIATPYLFLTPIIEFILKLPMAKLPLGHIAASNDNELLRKIWLVFCVVFYFGFTSILIRDFII